MNPFKFTPGPWKACRAHEDFNGPYFDIDPEERAEYENRPYTSIDSKAGRVVNAHDLFTFKPENAEAIALLPDLVSALQDAAYTLNTSEYEHDKEQGREITALLDKLR